METGSDSRQGLQQGPGHGALGTQRRKYLLLPGEQGGGVHYRRLPRGRRASALSGRVMGICQTDFCGRVMGLPVPIFYLQPSQKSGSGLCGFHL